MFIWTQPGLLHSWSQTSPEILFKVKEGSGKQRVREAGREGGKERGKKGEREVTFSNALNRILEEICTRDKRVTGAFFILIWASMLQIHTHKA